MNKLKQYKYIILILLIVLGFIFYWYEIRPAKIRHNCSWSYSGDHWYEAFDDEYNFCIHEKGLSK